MLDGARFQVLGNCIINAWSGPARAHQIAVFDQLMHEVSAVHPGGVLMFVVLEPGAMLSDPGQRKEAEAAYARWAGSIRAVAQVVEGHNLWAATARSIMVAIRLVERRPYPMKVFSELVEATRWCAPHFELPREVDPQVDRGRLLLDATRNLRAL